MAKKVYDITDHKYFSEEPNQYKEDGSEVTVGRWATTDKQTLSKQLKALEVTLREIFKDLTYVYSNGYINMYFEPGHKSKNSIPKVFTEIEIIGDRKVTKEEKALVAAEEEERKSKQLTREYQKARKEFFELLGKHPKLREEIK